jgi:membrane protein DedA with SNARE-associated domain
MINQENLKKSLASGYLPLLIAVAFSVFSLLYDLLDFPSPKELSIIGKNLYEQYGLIILLLASLLEGIFMVNIYIPGSFVIVLSVFLSDKSIDQLFIISIIVWAGFFSSSIFNYWLGATGFYKALLLLGKKNTIERMQVWINKKGGRAIFLSSIHPNFQAITMVCAGISRYSFLSSSIKSAVSLIFWVPIWTVVFSIILKRVDIENSNGPLYVIGLLVLVGIVSIIIEYVKLSRKSHSS